MSLVEYKNSHTSTIYISLVPMLLSACTKKLGKSLEKGLGFCILATSWFLILLYVFMFMCTTVIGNEVLAVHQTLPSSESLAT